MEFQRNIYDKLAGELKNTKVSVIFGARQVGKTFLMKKLAQNASTTKFFDLEQPMTLAEFNKSDAEIIDMLISSDNFIFIDEFHYVKNISHLFKAIYDSDQKIKIFASGSSALEMHKHLKESLAGRYNKFYLYPLSYEEFLSTALPEDLFLKYGGLPGTYFEDNKEEYLNQIFSTYIQKDIKSLIKDENIRAFNNLLLILAENQGQLISNSNLSRELGVSSTTVDSYLSILEQTFVLYPLTPFSGNLSNELKKSKKYYLYDFGIRNAILKDFREITKRLDKGVIWETFVYYHLISIKEEANTDIHFWRTSSGNEVDFIWRRNRQTIPIEVKSKIKNLEVPDGVKKFLKAYPKSEFAIVVNESITEETQYKEYPIYFVKFQDLGTMDQLLLNF